MSITKLNPSASTNGKPIKITTTATPGDTFHTATAGTSQQDEVYMFLHNSDTVDRKVTVQFGGVTEPDNEMFFTVPAKDSILAVPGIPLNNGLLVKAYADAANVVTMSGYVNKIV